MPQRTRSRDSPLPTASLYAQRHAQLADEQGHLGASATTALPTGRLALLSGIYTTLGGNETLLAGKRAGSDPRIDLIFPDRGLAVEVDEIQHFTRDRLQTLERYTSDVDVLFSVGEYRRLIGQWQATADRYRAAKPATDFPHSGGRRAQRAYFDAFRDIAAPSFGLRVLRIPAPECDGMIAYSRLSDALAKIL